ncbi:DUF488 domain-containing protein [Catellatospora bangladeshensis]|uniref:DUF488 family protein n=1 Tax=Catellatospora bangladeshensis TaxID=310355 RepID=A0A8J3NKS0_9ACTN|nr:DUF488 family protein [Catellatospora bangladeshensis]GIF84312.1 hypothetical protein Cba03nite_56610 [Catellatospora bangladeshensis]
MPSRAAPASHLRMRRVYDEPSPDDGRRVLVDRLWPRGLAKEQARVDDWPKDLTPSTELRRWYHESPEDRHTEFVTRYEAELGAPAAQEALRELREHVRQGTVTLLTAVKDIPQSHLEVLARHLR